MSRSSWPLALVLAVSPSAVADVSTDVETCVIYSQTPTDAPGALLILQSTCEPRLRCRLKYRVGCKKQRKTTYRRLFELRTGESYSESVDASHCGERPWRVDGVRWSCAPIIPKKKPKQ